MVCWPGRRPPDHIWEKRLADGDHCNVSRWTLNAHTGTHIDAPLHFAKDGISIDQISPDVLVGPCRVIDLGDAGGTTGSGSAVLDGAQVEAVRGESRLLIRTSHSTAGAEYAAHGAIMSPEAARMLIESGLVVIGTDRLSVDDSPATDYSLHHLFLEANCIIIEGLYLARINPGPYQLVALPLRFEGAEASPARVLLSPTVNTPSH